MEDGGRWMLEVFWEGYSAPSLVPLTQLHEDVPERVQTYVDGVTPEAVRSQLQAAIDRHAATVESGVRDPGSVAAGPGGGAADAAGSRGRAPARRAPKRSGGSQGGPPKRVNRSQRR
jgi:hypothetical protein